MLLSFALPPVLLGLLPAVLAVPAPIQVAEAPYPMITPPPSLADRAPSTVQERGIISSIESSVEGLGSYIASVVGTYPSYIASGVPNFFQDLPTGSAVESSLGISDSDLAATPTQVLNIPGYANWTSHGWNLRFHGNVFKQPNISESKLDDLANIFLIGTSIQDLPPAEQTQARNLTAEIYVVQQGNVNVSFNIQPASGEGQGAGNAITPGGGAQNISLVGQTTAEGDFDEFLPLANVSGPGGYLLPGNETTAIQREEQDAWELSQEPKRDKDVMSALETAQLVALTGTPPNDSANSLTVNVFTNGTDTGNATSYLVPTAGLTIISDIDDILRITQIYEPAQGLLNSFAKAYVPWMNMPDIYANWSRSIPDFHFHYLTTTPEQVTRNYMDFIYKTYPGGSFDTRPLNFSDVSETLSVRKFLLEKIFQTYPERKFILIADTSNSDVMRDYPAMVTEFPGQVQCIFLRNTTATDPGDQFPYDTSGFQGINQNMYMFFLVPDDLTNLDVVNGQCYNSSIPQNVTFSEQGLPFGLSKKSGAKRIDSGWGWKSITGLIILFNALLGEL